MEHTRKGVSTTYMRLWDIDEVKTVEGYIFRILIGTYMPNTVHKMYE